MQDIYTQTRKLVSRCESTQKPVVIKGDVPHHKLMMFEGRNTFYFSQRLSHAKNQVEEYLKFLENNNFSVSVEKSPYTGEIISFKARLKNGAEHEHDREFDS